MANLGRGQGDVPQHRQVGEQVERLEDHAHVPADGVDVAHVVGQLDAVDDDVPPLVLLQAVDGADESGLAGPGGADDDHHLTLLNGGGDAPQGVEVAVPLVNVAAHDDVFDGIRGSVGSHGEPPVRRVLLGVVAGVAARPAGLGSRVISHLLLQLGVSSTHHSLPLSHSQVTLRYGR